MSTLPTTYQEFIALSRYSRFRPDLGRRETWEETVDRLISFWADRLPQVPTEKLEVIREAIVNLDVMPSMRTLMTAGPALARDEMAGFNCSAAAITSIGPTVELWNDNMKEMGYEAPVKITLKTPIVFDELFYILLCGTGVGFSVERQFTNEMPTVGKPLSRAIYAKNNKNFPGVPRSELSTFDKKSNTVIVADSKYGWASGLRIFLVELYNGNFDVKYDVSLVRKAGSILKTFGGRASGSGALVEMFEAVRKLLKAANGRKLSSLECHDLMCLIAQAVVVGGVRRSALISLSNLSDERLRYAKSGEWWNNEPQRALANNTVAYTEKPSVGSFMREWQALYDGKSGERGIFNREAAKKACVATGRNPWFEFLVNPCGEALLRHTGGLCNLTEVVVRPDDSYYELQRKVAIASFIGTMQSTLTNFVYVNPQWKKNAEEERLLGVSVTGATDHFVLKNVSETAEDWLRELRKIAVDTNRATAELLGINPSVAITLNKPSGTVSQLVDSASGLHARYSPYYIRRVRADAKDPLAQVMQQQGYPWEYADGSTTTLVFSFPVKSPEGAVFRDDRTATEQLEYWMMWKKNWCDSHNPSVTIYVKEHEWLEVGAWVYKNFDDICGLSFLPHSDHVYKQAPYTECTKDQYEALLSKMPKGIDYEALSRLETTDQTTGTQEYACVSGACDLI